MQSTKRRRFATLQSIIPLLLLVSFALAGPPAHAGGFDRVTTVFDNINGILIAAGVSIMTMAILWCGYKVTFRGAGFEDISKPMLGGIILGAAPTLAGFLLG